MARIVSLRAHLERITEEFAHGVYELIAAEAGERLAREASSRPVLRAVDSGVGERASSRDVAPRKRGRPPTARVIEAAPSRPSRATDTATKAEAPNAVTDPELLLAALEQRSDAPVSGTHERPARGRRPGRPSKSENGAPAILAPVVAEPPVPVAGPALRGDEVSLRTLRGGVVIKRVRRQEAV